MKFTLLLLLPCLTAAEPEAVRQAASRGMAKLVESATAWKQDCFSCHHQALPQMAARIAREHAVTFDERAMRAAAENTYARLASVDEALADTMIIDPALSEGYLLVSARYAGVAPSVSTALYARRLANHQRPDGYWVTLDGRPPQSYSRFSATALASYAIAAYLPHELEHQKKPILARAASWLVRNPAISTEDLTFRLLGLLWTAAADNAVDKARNDLLVRQRGDGGWGQLSGLDSDPYSTGEVLTALAESGYSTATTAYQKGLDYLLNAQNLDGSWHVRTRIRTPAAISPPYFETGYPHAKDQFISAAAASWSVMALAHSLPRGATTPVISSAVPKDVKPWIHAAAFGTLDDLRRLLDGGLDPNAATQEGSTVLMFAANDPAKVRLLLERGAKLEARNKAGYNALLIASSFRGTVDTVKLLIERGADAGQTKGARHNASPLVLATFAGDSEVIRYLAEHRAPVNGRMLLLGVFPVSPLFLAAFLDEPDSVRFLASKGAKVEETDADRMSVLAWAVLTHKTASAKALLELGANPKRKDKFGLSPKDHLQGIANAPAAHLSLFP